MFTVTDFKNRYAPIPWEDKYPDHMRGWIETDPLCTDIYATDETVQERLDYFTSKDGFMVGEVKTWIQQRPDCKIDQTPPSLVLQEALKRLITEQHDTIIIPCSGVLEDLKDRKDPDSVAPCAMSIDFTRAADIVYDFENVEKVWIYSQPYDPALFTFSNPIVMTAHQVLTIKLVPAVVGEPIKCKLAFLSCALRNKNCGYMAEYAPRSGKAD
jgi:hypothetical protein